MAPRISRRNRKKQQKDLVGKILIFLVLIIAVVGSYYYIKLDPISVNPETLCPESKHINSNIAILIDGTDQYNNVQKSYLDKFISNFINANIVKNDKISIYAIDDKSYKNIAPVVELCNPGSGEDVNPAIGNPRKAQKLWEDSFNLPLTNSIDQLLEVSTSNASPILEMIQSVAINSFPIDAKNKKLIIISDLIHNTSEYSQYKAQPTYKEFEKLTYSKHVRTNLSGVDVTILYLIRAGMENYQNRRHLKFWEDYIDSMNGSISRIVTVEG